MDNLSIIKKEVNALSIPNLEKAMLQQEQADAPVYHHFAPGIYIRELHLEAETLAVGHHHKTAHLNICLKGKLTLFNEDKTETVIEAPAQLIAQPGRKVAYIHDDIVWLNVFATEETNVERLEEMFFDKSKVWEDNQPEQEQRNEDVDDFDLFLKEFNFTADEVRKISESRFDQMVFPQGSYNVAVYDSNIEGKGLFATAPFKSGDMIAPARIGLKRTPAGRYANHAKTPNAKMVEIGNNIHLKAIKDIEGSKGGRPGEEITVDYRQTVSLNKGVLRCQE